MKSLYNFCLYVINFIIAKEKRNILKIKLDKSKQLRFLKSLDDNDGLDLIGRSINQYRCQEQLLSFRSRLLLNVGSFAFLWFIVPFLLLANFFYNPKKRDVLGKAAVYFGVDRGCVPKSVKEEFDIVWNKKLFVLTAEDVKFISQNFFKLAYSPYFMLKCVLMIALYRGNIITFNPKALIVTREYSFASSVATKYCEANDILHINIMHGEKLFNITDAFFKFHRCYVWDDFYKKLFIRLKADEKQFVTEIPEIFIKKVGDKLISNVLTYYLVGEEDSMLYAIKSVLDRVALNYKIKIRPHPKVSDFKVVEKIFYGFTIENPKEVSILDSINGCSVAVSTYSTVLFQAYLQDKIVVIDDLSDEDTFATLKDLEYQMLARNHVLLSDFICRRHIKSEPDQVIS